MNSKKITALLLAFCLVVGLDACAATTEETIAVAPETTQTAAPVETEAPEIVEENTELSGKVTVYMPSPAGRVHVYQPGI